MGQVGVLASKIDPFEKLEDHIKHPAWPALLICHRSFHVETRNSVIMGWPSQFVMITWGNTIDTKKACHLTRPLISTIFTSWVLPTWMLLKPMIRDLITCWCYHLSPAGYVTINACASTLICFSEKNYHPFPRAIIPLRPRQDGRYLPDDILKCIFFNENVLIPITFSLKFVPKGPINNIPALVQIMAWRRLGDKPLSEPMMVSLLTHICVTRPQWVILCGSIKNNIFHGVPTQNGLKQCNTIHLLINSVRMYKKGLLIDKTFWLASLYETILFNHLYAGMFCGNVEYVLCDIIIQRRGVTVSYYYY